MSRRILITLFLVLLLCACTDSGREQGPAQNGPTLPSQGLTAPTDAERILQRVASVLSGYQAFSGRPPGKLTDLDGGEYMFDSAYLAEILPEGGALYLLLGAEGEGTRIWLQQGADAPAFSRSLSSEKLERLDAAALAQLKAGWREVASVGRVTQVRF